MPLPQTIVRDGTDALVQVNTLNSGRQNAADSAASVLSNEDYSAIGAPNSAAAADETATASLNALLKGVFARLRNFARAAGNVTADTLRVVVASDQPAIAVAPSILGTTTREYAVASGVRAAVGVSSSSAVALPTLGASREVRVSASTRCWVRFGTGSVAAAAVDATCLPIESNSPEVIRIPVGVTHFTAIRDTGASDGFITFTPVA